MPQMRTERELNELIALARDYCSLLAECRYAKAEGRLSEGEEVSVQQVLARMDEKIELLKSNNELDRRRANLKTNIIPLANFKRRAAR